MKRKERIMEAIKIGVIGIGLVITVQFYNAIYSKDIKVVKSTPTPIPTSTATLIPTSTPTPTVTPIVSHKATPTSKPSYASRGTARSKAIKMRATAYDLSVASCGKTRTNKQYGITKTGVRATVRHTVAVDPKFIPLGTKLYIEFPESDSFRNGIYHAEDTGNKVLGNIIDIYLGEDEIGEKYVKHAVDNFGCKPVSVYILKGGS